MKTICIDIDGTISHYIDWVDDHTFGSVLAHCAESIQELKSKGWLIIIYTTRANNQEISKFLYENDIPFDFINENPNQPENAKGGKPYADVYVDDRAIGFKGDWQQTLKDIENFKPWEMDKAEQKDRELSQQLLVNDFQQAFYMLRHYDEVNWNLTKFAFGQILVSLGACWTIFYKSNELSTNIVLQDYSLIGMVIILLLSAGFSLMTILAICKNRSYFVRVSRYINEHRHFAFECKKEVFINISKMWNNPNFPKVKDWCSTQMICLYLLFACYLLELTLASGLVLIENFCFCKLFIVIALLLSAIIACVKIVYNILTEY